MYSDTEINSKYIFPALLPVFIYVASKQVLR